MEYLWHDFLMLSRGRTSNGFGANPLTWIDVLAWARLTGLALSPWETDTLIALDNAWMVDHSARLSSNKTAKPAQSSATPRR